MILGDWIAPEPLQGVHLTPITGGLWFLRAVGICGGLTPNALPTPGVMAYASMSNEYEAVIQSTPQEFALEAERFGGIVFRAPGGSWIIKAIAPGMRDSFAKLT